MPTTERRKQRKIRRRSESGKRENDRIDRKKYYKQHVQLLL